MGFNLHRLLPEHHLSKETHDVIRLGAGMLSVLTSLVLGLLIATVKSGYDNTNSALRTYAADLTVLDTICANTVTKHSRRDASCATTRPACWMTSGDARRSSVPR